MHADTLNEYIRARMEAQHTPGVSLAVLERGDLVFAQGYGQANVELSVPAAPETVYQLASVTKQFTAAAAMLLVGEGKLGLDDGLLQHLPDLPSAWEGVTLRHLLTHTSGIKSMTDLPDFMKTIRKDNTPDEMLAWVKDVPPEFAPGERYAYNNTGYFLLGLLIEKASGKAYGDFLTERIFEPLGMTRTRVNDLHAIIPGRAAGYTWGNETLRNGEYVSPTQPYAAGALVSTVLDLARWEAALWTDTPLPQEALKQMWTPAALTDGTTVEYGFGWSVRTYRGHRQIGHGGGIPGFSTYIARFPDEGLAVIVLSNSDRGDADQLARGVAALYIPALTEPEPAIEDEAPQTTEGLRELLVGITEGNVKESRFTPGARAVLFPDRIKRTGDFLASLGGLSSFTLIEHSRQAQYIQRRYRAMLGETILLFRFLLTSEGTIHVMEFRPD